MEDELTFKDSVSAILFLLQTLLRDILTLLLHLIFPPKDTEKVYYAPTHAIRFDNSEVFTFDRREVVLTVLRKQLRELRSQATSWVRRGRGQEGTEEKDASVFDVVKFANKWINRNDRALKFGKVWFTNGNSLFILFHIQ